MADLNIPGGVNPQPNVKVRKLWAETQIAELEAAIKRLEVDAQELIQARLKRIEAEIIMKKRKVVELTKLADQLDQFGLDEVVEIEGVSVKRLTN